MSKGTNNSNDSGMSMQYLGDLIQKILDSKTTSVDPVSQEFYNKLLSNFNTIVGILKDDKQVTAQELKKIVNYTKSTLSTDYGVKFTERFNKSLSQFEKSLEDKIKNEKGKVDANKLVASLSNIVASAVAQSLRAEQRGSKGALLRGVSKDSSEMKALADEIAKKIGMEQVADGAMAKLIGFFKGEDKEKEKKLKKFGEDLIEGLANNKFVGGALTDTFKLIGLMGASWLSQFGQLGRILGGAFYVAMSTAGPLLVNSLLKGMGNLLAKGIVSLGKFIGTQGGRLLGAVGRGTANLASSVGRGAMDLSFKAGGPLADLATAGTTGQKALAVGRVAGGAAVGLGALAGAVYAGKEGVDSWKQGRKGNALAFGAGGLALGAGAIAAVIAGAFAPVTLTLVGIGAAIVGISALWKRFHKDTKDHNKKMEEEAEKKQGFWSNFINWLKSCWPWGNKNATTQQEMGENATVGKANKIFKTGTSAELLTGVHKGPKNKHLDLKKMTEADWQQADTLEPVYGSMGQILNLGKMSQRRAQEVVEADIKAKGDKSFYEALDKDLIKKGSFTTDIPYAARGTSDKFKDLLARAEKEGFDTSNIKITSAIGTLGSRAGMSPHAYTSSIKGHFNEYGTTIDLSNLYNKETGKRITQSDLNRMGLGDYWLNSEGDHEHIAFGKYAWMNNLEKQQKEKAEEAQKVVAQKHSVEAEAIYARMADKELYDSVRKGAPEDEERKARYYENLLKKKEYGITYDKDKNEWIQIKNGEKSRIIVENADPDGNKDFSDAMLSISKIVNNG